MSLNLATIPIIDWPPEAQRIALTLGRSDAFLLAMQCQGPNRVAWLAAKVTPILRSPDELSTLLHAERAKP